MEQVASWEARAEQLEDHDPAKPDVLNELAKARWAQWLLTGQKSLLDGAITSVRQAVQQEHGSGGAMGKYQNNLGVFLTERANNQADNQNDIYEAIEVLRNAVTNDSPQSGLGCTLHFNLANSLQHLYHAGHDPIVLEETIATYHEGLAGNTSLGNKPKLLNGMCESLLSKFTESGNRDDLDMAIQYGEAAVEESNDSHPYRATFLDTYAGVLFQAFKNRGDVANLELALYHGEDAMTMSRGSIKWPQFASDFAAYLVESSRTRHDCSDLGRGISLLREASKGRGVSEPVSRLAKYRLALSMRYLFEETGIEEHLSESIKILSNLLTLSSDADEALRKHETERACAVALANSLLRRFDLCGSPADIDLAVAKLRGLIITPENSPQNQEVWGNLSVALLARFDLRGGVTDLDEAEDTAKSSLDMTDVDHPEYTSSLVALANVYLRAFHETGDGSHLDQAIQLYDDALAGKNPWKKLRSGRLATLSYALQLRYARNKVESDWTRCLQACVEAVEESTLNSSSGSGNHWRYIGQLGSAHLERYQAEKPDKTSLDSLHNAIQYLTTACKNAPEEHTSRALFLNNLGLACEMSFKESKTAPEYDLAIDSYRQCVVMSSASKLQRITAAYRGTVLTGKNDLQNAAWFATSAINLLPKLSPRLLPRVDQEHLTSLFSGLGSYSAAILLEAGEGASAAALALETTRGLIGGLLMETREDVVALEADYPDLAREFSLLSRQLDPQMPLPSEISYMPFSSAGKGDERIKAANDLDKLISKIQSIEDFGKFLAAPTENDLMQLAGNAFIIMVNVTSLRCDAIVVSSTSIENLKLDAANLRDITHNANRLLKALASDNTSRRRQTNKTIKEVLTWLWTAIVSPIYQHVAARQGEKLRICWMPVGIMSFFPLHAAMSQDSSLLAIELITSSYATTFKSLRFARRKAMAQPPPTPLTATLVSMAETPNQRPLRFAGQEAETLESLLGRSMAVSRLGRPTKAAVLAALADSAILHMSCHGIAEPDDPSSSRLLLCDWESNPLTVADLAAHRLPCAQFCYLSACHAASNLAPELVDESIHLASAMQLAGFPRVVGTLWQVNDKGAMEISAMVWEELLKGADGDANFNNVAEALNKATRSLRESKMRAEGEVNVQLPDQPFIWAPFVYVGL